MKSTGVVRKIDELGRIVLPSEIRKVFNIREGDELDISVEGERVIIEKRTDVCVFCAAEDPGITFNNRRVCNDCAASLGQEARVIRLPEETPLKPH